MDPFNIIMTALAVVTFTVLIAAAILTNKR